VKARVRHRIHRQADLTSLFDVLFILVFAALIRVAATPKPAVEAAPPPPPAPKPPGPPPTIAAIKARALANLTSELGGRTPLVIHVTAAGVVARIEAGGKTLALDVPLLQHDPDPMVRQTYAGDRSTQLRVCRIAALELGVPDLGRYLVIVAPARPPDDLPEALIGGLERDVARCLVDQRGIATIVSPEAAASPAVPPPTKPR